MDYVNVNAISHESHEQQGEANPIPVVTSLNFPSRTNKRKTDIHS